LIVSVELPLHVPALAQAVEEEAVDAAVEGHVPLVAAPGRVPPVPRGPPWAGGARDRAADARGRDERGPSLAQRDVGEARGTEGAQRETGRGGQRGRVSRGGSGGEGRDREGARPVRVDEVRRPGRLWRFILQSGLRPLFLSSGPSPAGEIEEDVFGALLSRAFPRSLTAAGMGATEGTSV